VQLFNKVAQAVKHFFVDGKVLELVHVVDVVPLDVDGDSGFLSLLQDLLRSGQRLVAELALLIAQTPVRRQKWLPDNLWVLLDDWLGAGSGKNVKVENSSESSESDGGCGLQYDFYN